MEKCNLDAVSDNHSSRRQFSRIPENCKIFVHSCNSDGTVIGDFSEQALILDYSQGGLRIQINKEIPTDSLLLVNFGNDFIVPQLQGITKICWHKKLENKLQRIEVGLVFKDHFSQSVLAVQDQQ